MLSGNRVRPDPGERSESKYTWRYFVKAVVYTEYGAPDVLCGLRVGTRSPGPEDSVCGFCGRPPDQVGNLVFGASGSTICRSCTTNLLAIFDAPDLPEGDNFIIQVEPENPR